MMHHAGISDDSCWIRPKFESVEAAPQFEKKFCLESPVRKAILRMTGVGVYRTEINTRLISDAIFAPGWTSYRHRLQVQTYDVTSFVQAGNNTITVILGRGWFRSRLVGRDSTSTQDELRSNSAGIIASLHLEFADGTHLSIPTDNTWKIFESRVRFSEIYDGEIFDASQKVNKELGTEEYAGPSLELVEQQGEAVKEQVRIPAANRFKTPKGELVYDFGQEITGYVEVCLKAHSGESVDLSFAEVLDQEGNFYTDNYRSAKAQYRYICTDGQQTYHPYLTFYGFRYIRVNAFPGGIDRSERTNFTGIAIWSDMKRTGSLITSDTMLNQLFSNILWSQRGNFVDVPTDCPQRDERLGWTGDAEIFVKTACYNYDAEKFYDKWLTDLKLDQREDGCVPAIVPDLMPAQRVSAAWGDAAVIIPWEVYQAYGDKDILSRQFDSMKSWVDYVTHSTETPGLWTGGLHFGDWLGLDAPSGSYKGSSRDDLIATAYYSYSTSLLIKAGEVLGKDMTSYSHLYQVIVKAFRQTYSEYYTQTEHVVALQFHLAANAEQTARELADMIICNGKRLTTGFVGTPYLLHVLTDHGYTELAWDLIFSKDYPSWLYPITKGATTIWEHWDNVMPDGSFWSPEMNSFNHYAYGSIGDWFYSEAAGITPLEPGYRKIRICPHTDRRLSFLAAKYQSRTGEIKSLWVRTDTGFRYEINTPADTEIVIAGRKYVVPAGGYVFFS